MPGPEGKPFAIPKAMVWEAWRRVKANKGAAGVDGQDLEKFEADLGGNLYKIWNRMSSGSYLPPPVRAVEIPKPHGGGVRMLGVPTIADRVAQTVVARHLEERADHRFHPDSYGYRPGRSAHEALAACRQRCWKYDWVIDLDVQKFFDEVPWDLVLGAVQVVTDARWVQLYVERWLAAPLQHPDGALEQRTKGTPQVGGLADPGEPVHALRVRHVDGPELPGLPVRALRRRRGRALQDAPPGGARARRDRRADTGGGAQAAPGQDADRLLQRRSAPGPARAHLVHLPRVRLPGHGGRAARTAGTSPGSCLRSAPRRSRPKAPSSAGCGSTGAPTCRFTTWRGG